MVAPGVPHGMRVRGNLQRFKGTDQTREGALRGRLTEGEGGMYPIILALILKRTRNTHSVGLPPGGRDIQTLGTSKYRSHSRRDHGPSRTHFGLDAGRGSSRVHREEPGCERNFSCGCLCSCPFHHRPVRRADSLTSYPMLPKVLVTSILAI